MEPKKVIGPYDERVPRKPHITRVGDVWVCAGRGCGGVGVTPVIAYHFWLRRSTSDRGDRTHVYSCFGRKHEMSPDCWCQPQTDGEQPRVIVHNVEH